MRTRKYDWFDLGYRKPLYGLQIKTSDGWSNVAENGKPCLFDTPEEREAKRAELRKIGHCQLACGKVV